jgi:hypothetical protein
MWQIEKFGNVSKIPKFHSWKNINSRLHLEISCSGESFVFPYTIKNVKIRIYKIVILWLVLYGCEILSLTWKEQHVAHWVWEKGLSRIVEHMREVIEEWKRHMAHMGEKLNAYKNW